jgi:hypothetical protein
MNCATMAPAFTKLLPSNGCLLAANFAVAAQQRVCDFNYAVFQLIAPLLGLN